MVGLTTQEDALRWVVVEVALGATHRIRPVEPVVVESAYPVGEHLLEVLERAEAQAPLSSVAVVAVVAI
jgi:hypothetical protein